jgi:hypothetical protein
MQFVKFSIPNARLSLWQVAQDCARADAWCMSARGEATCRPCASPALTVWQLVQVSPRRACAA